MRSDGRNRSLPAAIPLSGGTVEAMAPPNIAARRRASQTLRAFGQRIPGAGGVLAQSLADAVEDRIVLITGASQGIGRATALQIGRAGGAVLLVSRTQEKLEEVAREIEALGGTAHVHSCDLTDPDDIDRMANEVLEQHGHVDILINNAGRSIRRSVSRSYDRFHDYQRTMQVNYFGPVKLILKLLPVMRERGSGHIINISTIGLQTNTPRFAAYLASKAALDAFSRSIGPEIIDDGVHITTVYMPLVRTPMIAPTKIYDRFPTLSPEEAAEMICDAIRKRPKRVATALGNLGQLDLRDRPRAPRIWSSTRPTSCSPRAARSAGARGAGTEPTAEQRAFVRATRGVHW